MRPNSASALKHHHSKQDEFTYIISGTPTLIYGDEEIKMSAGDCVGFKVNNGLGHHLVNESSQDVVYIEIGDRSLNDKVEYPNDDLAISQQSGGLRKIRVASKGKGKRGGSRVIYYFLDEKRRFCSSAAYIISYVGKLGAGA